jgi:hypothetical protein
MRYRQKLCILLSAPLLLPLGGGVLNSSAAHADDGPMVRKSVAKTPHMESEHAQFSMMQFYVPATTADGTLRGTDDPLQYFADRDGDNQPDELLFTRTYAKPLVVTYLDEEESTAANYDIETGDEIGPDIRRDTWAAVSMDDGETWKSRNLSESAVESSFTLANGIVYPGDVTGAVHAVAGNQILVAWTSKYCGQGSPRYSLKDELDIDGDGDTEEALYEDLFGVSGNQRSIDYSTWMHHGSYPFEHIGEIPFSCVWTARGTVEYQPPGQGSEVEGNVWGIRWRNPERLTSGRRDAYKLEIDGVESAGFAITWQEDPEGLRPGYGEGPGVGWSGATVNHKADIWYSSIGWNDFALIEDPLTPGVPAIDPDALETNKPKVFEPMAMPVRLTDNEKCELVNGGPKTNDAGEITALWCYDLDVGDGTVEGRGTPDGIGDLCPVSKDADGNYTVVDSDRVVQWTNSRGITMDICVSDDGRMLNGQTGSSRARFMMEGYTKADSTKSAWVALIYEESKGLGAGHPEEGEEMEEALDIGKDAMYHTFDMFRPDLAAAGHMLNMPETDPLSDPLNPTFLPLLTNDLAVAKGLEANQYNTSIGRRGSLMLQPTPRLVEAGYPAGMTTSVLLYKSGADRQGGPADIFMRRTVLPDGFDPTTDNPFAVENLACDVFDANLSDGDYATYPRTSYPYGLCVRGSRNLSSTTPLTFEPLGNDEAVAVATPGWHDPSWTNCSACHHNITDDGYELPSHGITDRVLTWTQTAENLLDEDWVNKYEVAKGHRGFIDGDFVMVMYGWSPNWLATSHGHEPYNLFIRRSFDGGVTWTTTPTSLGGDGTTYDQVHGVGDRVWTETRTLAAGEFEPARNVSQLTSNKETILDPRYSPTNMGTQSDVTRVLNQDGTYDTAVEPDLRDPSKFFAVYETGDATVVLTAGEADPWDMFGSRAVNWGDDWATVDVFAQGQGVWEERWDWIENKDEVRSGEGSMGASPDGQFAWIVWNQWTQHETDLNGDGFEDVTDSDPMFRRLWWDDAAVTIIADAGLYEAEDGEIVMLEGDVEYDGTESELFYSWDLDMDGLFETEGQVVELLATGAMQGVAVKVCDGAGNCDVDQGWVNKGVRVPRVWRVQTEANPSTAGVPVQLTARYVDPGTGDTHNAMIDWGDGTVEAADTVESIDGKGAALVVGEHIYNQAGLYTIKVTVTDNDGYAGWDYLEYAVVYDQQAGTVDAAVNFADPGGSGTAYLEFNARYSNLGVDPAIPVGKVKFSLPGLGFVATGFEWLVISGNEVFLKAEGAVNGEDGYDCLIAAVDGKPDLVRIRIWKRNGLNQQVFYDSQSGALDAMAATRILKGKVTIEDN